MQNIWEKKAGDVTKVFHNQLQTYLNFESFQLFQKTKVTEL